MSMNNSLAAVVTNSPYVTQDMNFRLRLDIGGANLRIQDKIIESNGQWYVDPESGLDIDFDIVKTWDKTPNKSTIVIYNLNNETYNKINEEKNNTNSFESKTVLFDTLIEDEFKVNNQINVSQVNTKIIDDEKNNENIHNTRTIKFEQVTKEQVEEENEYIKNIPRFNLKENFEKILEESESKTIKFQTTSNNLLNNEQRFTKHLNDMIFNETVNVEDLDLTKELKDVDAIKVKEDSNKKKKS